MLTPRTTSLPSTQWLPVFAGAITAVGISLTLTTFGAAVGLSVMSASPTWRDSSAWLWVGSGLYLVFVSLWAFGIGGYVTGRLRHPIDLDGPETQFRDGLWGVTAWGVALVISAFLALASAALVKPETTVGNSTTSSTAEALIPTELDQLFRDTKALRGPEFSYHRAEAGRILLRASTRTGVVSDDKTYLAALVVAHTSLGVGDANTRVDRIIVRTRDALHEARVMAVMQAFMIAAALALGAAIAWFSSVEGGKERDVRRVPVWSWRKRELLRA